MKRVPYSFQQFKQQFKGSTVEEARQWLDNWFASVIDVESHEWNLLLDDVKNEIARHYLEKTNG